MIIKQIRVLSIFALVFMLAVVLTAAPGYKEYQARVKNKQLLAKRIDYIEEVNIGTKEVFAGVGDYILQNNKIKVSIADLDKELGSMSSGGTIVDMVTHADGRDQLESVFMFMNDNVAYQPYYDKIEVVKDGTDNKEAIIRVSGYDLRYPDISIITEYSIKNNDHYVVIKTTVENNGEEETIHYSFTDSMRWGSTTRYIPMNPRMPLNKKLQSDWIAAIGGYVSYGYANKKGSVLGIHGESYSDVTIGKYTVKPGEKVSFERIFIAGNVETGTISNAAYMFQGVPYCTYKVRVIELDTKIPLANAHVRIMKREKSKAAAFTKLRTDDKGMATAILPPGEYAARVTTAVARRALYNQIPVKVLKAGDKYFDEIEVSPAGKIKFRIVDADTDELIPGKLTFIPRGNVIGAPFPYDYKADGSSNIVYSHTGEGTVEFSGGPFKIYASRGVEYEMDSKEIVIELGKTVNAEFRLKHSVRTPGYVSVDMNVHSSNSLDSKVSLRDRVISAVCEGVEVLIAADREHLTDYTETIEELELEDFITAIIGCEFAPSGDWCLGLLLLFHILKI